MSADVERVVHGEQVFAIVVRSGFEADGIHFFTPSDYSQQLGYMNRPAGYRVHPHVHLQVHRSVRQTLETLLIRRGRVRIEFFDSAQRQVATTELVAGDVILLVSGGHALTMLEPSQIIEVKQGPYAGDRDKELFEPEER